MRIIAVVNQKGGVGKTTTSVNLGAALALRGRRVLLVDMDPQGNLTDHLLGDAPEGQPRASVYDVLVEGTPILDALVPTSTPGLHVLPSHEDLAGAELDLASVIGREVLLRDALADVPEDAFDFVFLDCPPSLGLLSLNALAAAHEVFIALQTEFFAMRGLGALDRTVDLVKRRINPALRVTGIVPTLVDATRLSREVVDEVRGHYGELVFSSRVRSNIRLAEAPSHGKHIFDYAPDSPGAADYAALAKEVEEGRAAVEAPTEAAIAAPKTDGAAPAAAAAGGAAGVAAAAPTRLRGIARAIQEATADVVAGAGLPRPGARPAPGARAGMVGTGTSTPTAPATASPASSKAASAPAPAPADRTAIEAPAAGGTIAPAATSATRTGPAESGPTVEASATPAAATEPVPSVEAPSVPAAPSVLPPAPPPSSASVATPDRAAVRPSPPPAPARRASVPLPVLRSGPRPLSLPPMPTRPPSTLPRPSTSPRPPPLPQSPGRP